MTKTYVVQTNLHKEALLTYVRFKVKEEMATAKGDVAEAQKEKKSAKAQENKFKKKHTAKPCINAGNQPHNSKKNSDCEGDCDINF